MIIGTFGHTSKAPRTIADEFGDIFRFSVRQISIGQNGDGASLRRVRLKSCSKAPHPFRHLFAENKPFITVNKNNPHGKFFIIGAVPYHVG